MAIRDLVPWRRGDGRRALARREWDPFLALHRDMDQIFRRFWEWSGLEPFEEHEMSIFSPPMDVAETEDEVHVTVELPGMEKDDIELSMEGDRLVVRGEKKEQKEYREGDLYRSERYFGRFTREVPLPCEVDWEKAEATFKNGVLNVSLPKTEEARRRHKKIAIKSA